MTEGAADRRAESHPSRTAGRLRELTLDGRDRAYAALRTAARGAARGRRAASALLRRAPRARIIVFSTLTTRIFALTLLALGIQIGGLLVVSEYRAGLIELKLASLETEAEIIAVTIAESAGDPEEQRYDRILANEVLRRLALQTGLRAQIYDSGGRLTGDTRALLGDMIVVEDDSSPPASAGRGALGLTEALLYYVFDSFTPQLPLYRETPPAGITLDAEVYSALAGRTDAAERVNSEDELILSVAVPIKQVRTVMGALVLSTEGGDIDALASRSLGAILQGFAVAALVTLALSIALAHTIARPIRQLSKAAEDGLRREKAPLDPERIDIPDLSDRGDEIGYLSTALRRMTQALYQRIDAIESFAADVAHEIKNPLTSMRSAVESFRGARNDDQRLRLLEVIEQDVRRLDRLVTDISNASRLDAELVRERRERFNLVALLRTVIDITEAVCEEGQIGVTLHAEIAEARMSGLEERLAQVFLNLLDNAASFSPPGGAITVTLVRTRLGDKDAWRVDVADEGPGVPPENLESIFQRFYSERPDEHGFGEHSGLGLSICRQIVEAHGGQIFCANRRDRSGAIFSVALLQ